jgi:hypothetical protein
MTERLILDSNLPHPKDFSTCGVTAALSTSKSPLEPPHKENTESYELVASLVSALHQNVDKS